MEEKSLKQQLMQTRSTAETAVRLASELPEDPSTAELRRIVDLLANLVRDLAFTLEKEQP